LGPRDLLGHEGRADRALADLVVPADVGADPVAATAALPEVRPHCFDRFPKCLVLRLRVRSPIPTELIGRAGQLCRPAPEEVPGRPQQTPATLTLVGLERRAIA